MVEELEIEMKLIMITIIIQLTSPNEQSKFNVLHELYHHIVENKGLEISETKEERKANRFVRAVMKKSR